MTMWLLVASLLIAVVAWEFLRGVAGLLRHRCGPRSARRLPEPDAYVLRARRLRAVVAARERARDSRRCGTGHGDHGEGSWDRDPRLRYRRAVQPRPALSRQDRPERQGDFQPQGHRDVLGARPETVEAGCGHLRREPAEQRDLRGPRHSRLRDRGG